MVLEGRLQLCAALVELYVGGRQQLDVDLAGHAVGEVLVLLELRQDLVPHVRVRQLVL